MTEQLDAQGEAREALSTMVTDYSKRILSDPRMLGNVVTDLLPDLPRERRLLVTAAESDVAGELTRHVEEHRLDPDTAVQLVARSLTDRTALDPAASMWVTIEYAQALGYRVRSDASPPPPPPLPFLAAPEAEHTVTSYNPYAGQQNTAPPQAPPPGYPGGYPGGYSGQSQPQPSPSGGGYVPPPSGGGYVPPPPPGGGYVPPPSGAQGASPPPPGQMPWVPTPPPKKKRNLAPILTAGGLALVVVIYFAVAAVAKIAPFSSSKVTPTSAPSHTSAPVTKSPKSTPNPLAAGVAPLIQLVPSDVNPANCKATQKPHWSTPGLVNSLQCYDSALGSDGDSIFAYQMNSSAHYAASWANFNTWAGFSASSGSGCPPSGSKTQGTVPWNDTGGGGGSYYPAAAGQTLECGYFFANTHNQNEPTYAWSFPSEDAYVIAIGDAKSTFSHLQSWWAANADPNASPSPAAP
jgi:hypothetical protein